MNNWYILPGMGASSDMYNALRHKIDFEINFINWPDYREEKTYSEVARRVIVDYGIGDGDIVGGSSLGGMVALEIADIVNPKGIILLGSAITSKEVQNLLSLLAPLASLTPISVVQVLVGKNKNLVSSMFADTNPDFIRAMCAYLGSWKGYSGSLEKVYRLHGKQDFVIPCPASGCDIVEDAGHLIAMTHIHETAAFLKRTKVKLTSRSSPALYARGSTRRYFEVRMPYCPNPDCPHRQRLDEPAEFNPGIMICSDCGTTLSDTAPHFESIRKSIKLPKIPSTREQWTCPECGSINFDEISRCTCGYDSNRPAISAYQRAKQHEALKNSSSVEKKFRTFWRRVWAGAIDSTVLWPVFLVSNWVWITYKDHPVLLLLWFIFSNSAFHIYNIVFHGLYGQTLGKMAVNVRVTNITGDKLSMSQAFRRDMVPLLFFALSLAYDGPKILHGIYPSNPAFITFDFFFFLTLFSGMGWFFAEVVTMLTNKRRRAIHDYIAGSVVIKTEESANRVWSWVASLAVIIGFVAFFIFPARQEYVKKRDSLDHSKNSQNIVAYLKPDKSFPFIGFWKRDCQDTSGLAIDKTDDGKYSVSHCTSTACYKPGTEMPNTTLVDDPRYRIIDKNTIEIQIAGDYYWRYFRCTP